MTIDRNVMTLLQAITHPLHASRMWCLSELPFRKDQRLLRSPAERTGNDFTRFSQNGEPVHTFVGMGTFADHIVIKADHEVKIRTDAKPAGACYASCGGATGLGSVRYAGGDATSTQAVLVLAVSDLTSSGARRVGAKIIVGVDRNPAKERIAREMA